MAWAVDAVVEHISRNRPSTLWVSMSNTHTVSGFIFSKSLSLYPSIAKENGWHFICDARFRCIGGAMASLIMQFVFVWAEAQFFAISLSGNICLNRGPKWSDTLMGKLCSTIKFAAKTSAFDRLLSSQRAHQRCDNVLRTLHLRPENVITQRSQWRS